MLHINGNVAKLGDLDWSAAKPVVRRTKDVLRKRESRRVAREARERENKLAIVFSDGTIVRPIK